MKLSARLALIGVFFGCTFNAELEGTSTDDATSTDDGETEAEPEPTACASVVRLDADIYAATRSGLVLHAVGDSLELSRANDDGVLEPLATLGDLTLLGPHTVGFFARNPVDHDPATGKLWWLASNFSSFQVILNEFDDTGHFHWQREFGNDQSIQAQQVRVSDGELYLAGITRTYDYDESLWVMRLDAEGAPIWTRMQEANWQPDQARALLAHADGITLEGDFGGGDVEVPHVLMTIRPSDGETLWSEAHAATADSATRTWAGSDGRQLYRAEVLGNGPVDVVALEPFGQVLWTRADSPLPPLPPTAEPKFTWAGLDDGFVQLSSGSGAGIPLHLVAWAGDGTIRCETDLWVPTVGSIGSLHAQPVGAHVLVAVNLDDADEAYLWIQLAN